MLPQLLKWQEFRKTIKFKPFCHLGRPHSSKGIKNLWLQYKVDQSICLPALQKSLSKSNFATPIEEGH